MSVIESRVVKPLGTEFAVRVRGAQLSSGKFIRFEQLQLYDRPIDADKSFPQLRRSIPARAVRKAWRILKRASRVAGRGAGVLLTAGVTTAANAGSRALSWLQRRPPKRATIPVEQDPPSAAVPEPSNESSMRRRNVA